MPHRKNAKSDIGNAKKWSDSYDADNIYLSEEGWVYRHFKNTDRTLWWDEIIVAGQVVPNVSVHGVDNGDSILGGAGGVYNDGVLMTNPYKLGTISDVNFQIGDSVNDYRYSDHVYRDSNDSMQVMDKVVIEKNDTYSGTGFDQIAWASLNIDLPTEGELSTQIPDGWSDVSSPSDSQYGYPSDTVNAGAELLNHYTVAPDTMPGVPPFIIMGEFNDTAPGGYAEKVPSPGDTPAAEDNHQDTSGGISTGQLPVQIIP